MKKITFYLFLLSSVGELTSTLIDAPLIHDVCKPGILITLIAYYYLSVESEYRSQSLVLALICSLAGDVLLMMPDPDGLYFKLGLASFMAAHIFFIMTYRQHRDEVETAPLQGLQRIRLAFPIILTATGLLVILYPVLGNLMIPVTVYTMVIMIMALNALFRYGRTSGTSFFLVFTGALLFMASDSVLAINKFRGEIAHHDFIVMLTYIAAQGLIVQGLIAHNYRRA